MKNRRTHSFWKQLFQLFFLYLLLIPVAFALLDWKLLSRYFEKNAGLLIFAIAGTALIIALMLSLWNRHERRVHRW
jgi:uncharacterized membrane protein YcjF (UPF0283 family)